MKSKYMMQASFILISSIFLVYFSSSRVRANLNEGSMFNYLPVVVHPDPWLELGKDSAINGGISNTGTVFGLGPSLAISPNGKPCTSWADGVLGKHEIYIRCWDGSAWEEVGIGSASVGGVSNTPTDSLFPDLAIAPDGTIYVAWTEDWQNIYIRRWNGSLWEEVGEGSASGGGISDSLAYSSYPSLVVAPDGTLYVAWTESLKNINILHWNGIDWETVGADSASGGGISNTVGDSRFPFLAVSPSGNLFVAWQYINYDADYLSIYVRRWNGTIWEEVGLGSATGEGISVESNFVTRPSLAISMDEVPYISYIGIIYVGNDNIITFRTKRWNGIEWELVGDGWPVDNRLISNAEQEAIAISPDGFPCVAWSANSEYWDTTDIYIKCWNGIDWVKKGDHAASGGGVSNNKGFSIFPDLAIAPTGTMYVAWTDDGLIGYSYHEIYFRYNP